MKRTHYDVVVIGGGILGTMTAWKLSRRDLNIVVLDKDYEIGEGSAKANSGILYPGFQARGGSLKGVSCVQGNAMYDKICEALGIPMKRTGSLYVNFNEEGNEKMRDKFKNGLKNGVPDMEIISGAEARRMEPLLSSRIINALYAPNTALISPFSLIVSLAQDAAYHGTEFQFHCKVTGLEHEYGDSAAEGPSGRKRKSGGTASGTGRKEKSEVMAFGSDRKGKSGGTAFEKRPIAVHTSMGTITADYVINTAGGSAAPIESMVRAQNLIIKPRRGQFYIFDRQDPCPLHHVIFQIQEDGEKGTLIAPTVEGNLIAGPTSENVRTFSDTDTTRKGLAHVERVARKLLPDLDMGMVITNFAGIRANITNIDKKQKDFVIRRSIPCMVSALGIKNPGMTSAPYLTDRMIELLEEDGLSTERKSGPDKVYKRQKPFMECSPEEQNRLFAEDPRYARVVCRCEKITEGDIIHAMHSPLPPNSLHGFKKQLRVGMGRCQGNYCTSRIIDIVCRETGCEPQEFLKSTAGSNLVKGRLKG